MTTSKFKIGKCVRKKFDDKSFLVVRLTGKIPGVLVKKLRSKINEAVQEAQHVEPEE